MSVKIKLLTRRPDSNNECPVILRACKNKKQKTITTGLKCSIKLWDFDHDLPKRSHPNYKQLKERIIALRDQTAANIDNILEKPKEKDPDIKILEFLDKLIPTLSKGNQNVYQSLKSKLKKFNKRDVLIKEIDKNFIKDFEAFLVREGNGINGIGVRMRTFRAAINKAIERYNLEIENPFKDYNIRFQKARQTALDIEYLRKIRDLNLEYKSNIDLVRDTFLFSFYTMGMNISNICYLTHENLQGDYIVYIREKLKNQSTSYIKIKLTETILEQIDKWSNDSQYIFPIVRNDPYKDYLNFKRYANKKLKEIGNMVDCPITLTTNVARHTWASRAADLGISLAVIRDSLNHQNTRTTEDYLDSIDNRRINEANDQVTDL